MDEPAVTIEHLEIETPAAPTETDLHVAEHVSIEDRLAAHCAQYHASAEEAAQWTEMREIAELEAENAELRSRLETLEAQQTPAASSSSSSPPESPPEVASEIPSVTSSAETAPEPPPDASPDAPRAVKLETVIQEAPRAETAKSRGKRGSFRRSTGRIAARR